MIQVPYKKSIELLLGEARTTRQLWGVPAPHSLRRRWWRLHNRILSRTLGIIIHDSPAFRKIQCMASVWLDEHCVGHLMPAQCFLVFSTPRGVEHTHRRFTMKTCAFTGHRPKGLSLSGIRWAVCRSEGETPVTDYQDD